MPGRSVDQYLINEIVQKIADHCHPEKIILFGSYAWGGQSDESDVDLFIVMNSNQRRDRRAIAVSKLFSNRLFPMDVIVYTSDELEKSLRAGNSFIQEIVNKGKVLYAA